MMVLSDHVPSYYVVIVVKTVKLSLIKFIRFEYISRRSFTAILIKPSPLPKKTLRN